MFSLQKSPIRHQMSVLIGMALLLIASLAGISWWSLNTVGSIATNTHLVSTPRLQASNQLIAAVNARALSARNLVLLTSNDARRQELVKVTQAHEATGAAIQTLRRLTQQVTPDHPQARLLQAVFEAEATYGPVALNITRMAAQGETQTAATMIAEQCEPLLAKLLTATQTLQTQMAQDSEADFARLELADTQSIKLVLALGVAALALLVCIGTWISNGLIRSSRSAVAVVERMASGDLTGQIDASGKSEPARVLAALKQMNQQLRESLGAVRAASTQIGEASAEVASGANDLSARTEQAASSLEETASSMEEITATVQQTSDSARKAAQLAANSAAVARKAGESVGRVVANMSEIDRTSQRINEIIAVIDGIAFQTNILALNAAVEAARAGEQGRGFAVVASEVRNLAQRSATAAREIKALIDESSNTIATGSELVKTSGETIAAVVLSAESVNDIVSEITAASREQAEGIAQINVAVGQMDSMTQQNAALVEQSSAAAESLHAQAEQLRATVSRFKLSADEAHGAHQLRAQTSVNPTRASTAGRPSVVQRAAQPQGQATARLGASAKAILAPVPLRPAAIEGDWSAF
jgi:methyl-accepting chemotaxis protein